MRTNIPGAWQMRLIICIVCLCICGKADAFCDPRMINPVTEIAWEGIFPVKIGGVTVYGGDIPDTSDAAADPICTCFSKTHVPTFGISVSFWDPFNIIESVHDAWCLTSLGIKMTGITKAGHLNGTLANRGGTRNSPEYFAQAHRIIFPVWQILGLFTDVSCVDHSKFDVGYLTELDPLWQNDLASLVLNPEALIFGNPVLQAACMADAVAAAVRYPRNELFWCMGQWGSAYPLTGSLAADDPIMGAAGVAARMIYKLNRELVMCDHNVNACGCVHTPIWVKSNYRFQLLRPRADTGRIIRIGEPAPIWESNQAPPNMKGSDNFAFVIFRKVSCCMQYDWASLVK